MDLVIYAHKMSPPEALSPRLMLWDEDVWLCDLRPCHSYWRAQSRIQMFNIIDLFRSLLCEQLGSPEVSPWSAVLAHQPWHALLLLHELRARERHGLLNLASDFGRALYRRLSWPSWIHTAERYGEHRALARQQGGRAFAPERYQRQLRLLQRSMQRLGSPGPFSLGQGEPPSAAAMRRRFGEELAELWSWTAVESGGEGLVQSWQGFPWRSWQRPSPALRQRWSDHPLRAWQEVEPLLREDVDQLCSPPAWQPHDRLTRLDWHLRLDDLSILSIPIIFRHPHAPQREHGGQRTVLTQAELAFAATLRVAQRQARREHLSFPPIIGWELSISERWQSGARPGGLFAELEILPEEQLQTLENRLAIPLQAFALNRDWSPEHAYHSLDAAQDPETKDEQQAWLAAASARPLFYYPQPTPMAAAPASERLQLTECSANKWWHRPYRAHDQTRRYHRYRDERQRLLWVYRDPDERWFVHGLFD